MSIVMNVKNGVKEKTAAEAERMGKTGKSLPPDLLRR